MTHAGQMQMSQHSPVRVVIADDETLFRASLRHLLSAPPQVIEQVYGLSVGPGFEVVGEAGSGEDTVKVVRSTHPDLLLLDLSMPRMSGLEAIRELGETDGWMRTILLSGGIDARHLLTAVQLKVHGLILKDATTELLFEAILCVLAGRCWVGRSLLSDLLEITHALLTSRPADGDTSGRLTRREQEVLPLVKAGYPNNDIGCELGISEETVKHHLTRMFKKAGVSNRLELAMGANKHDLTGREPVQPEGQGATPVFLGSAGPPVIESASN